MIPSTRSVIELHELAVGRAWYVLQGVTGASGSRSREKQSVTRSKSRSGPTTNGADSPRLCKPIAVSDPGLTSVDLPRHSRHHFPIDRSAGTAPPAVARRGTAGS